MARIHTNEQLLMMLRDKVNRASGVEVAAEIGIGPSSLSDVLRGRKPVTPRIARWLLNREVEPMRVFREVA
jgi:hypothetical protein